MAIPNILEYYDENVPKGTTFRVHERWVPSTETTITIQPGTDLADFVDTIEMIIRDDLNLNGNTLRITNWGYDATTYQEAGNLVSLIAMGDATYYKQMIATDPITGGTANFHYIVIKFKPPKYLRNSTVPAESLVISLEGGGHITAGTIDISVIGWECAEDESGIE